jgi:hypothetical protein
VVRHFEWPFGVRRQRRRFGFGWWRGDVLVDLSINVFDARLNEC